MLNIFQTFFHILLLFLLLIAYVNLQDIIFFGDNEEEINRNCGLQNLQNKITSGESTGIDEYPWLALIRYKRESWGCGGSLIGQRTIITAAHCVENATIKYLGEIDFIRLGEYDVSTDIDCIEHDGHKDCADTPLDFKAKDIIVHPHRNVITKQNDIAMIILIGEVPYTDFIRPICLPSNTDYKIHALSKLFVAGWGWLVGYIQSPSNTKLQIKIDMVDTETCEEKLDSVKIEEDFQICAGGQNGKNACRGDSGGPLMVTDNKMWILAGIVSFGPSYCGNKGVDGAPSVYVKVASFLDWIKIHLV